MDKRGVLRGNKVAEDEDKQSRPMKKYPIYQSGRIKTEKEGDGCLEMAKSLTYLKLIIIMITIPMKETFL